MRTGSASAAGLVLWLLVALSTGLIGSRFLPGAWYAGLVKPAWNPPAAVFGPVWTVLYLMMGTAAWLVWRRSGWRRGRAALVVFLGQLALNALWSYVFFGARRMGLAVVEIAVLWLAIAATMGLFGRHSRWAAALLAPYLAWVSFAALLNFTLWRLNS